MRISLKHLLGLMALISVVYAIAAWALRSPAPDLWGYAKLGVSGGTPESAAYYLEVRGVDDRPTIARLVRFSRPSEAPSNALDVAQKIATELDFHTRNASRWSHECTLLAGRSRDEQVVIPLDRQTANKLFARPGDQFDFFDHFEEVWEAYVKSHLPPEQ